MGFAASLRETWNRATGRAESAEIAEVRGAAQAAWRTVEHLQESYADLENRMNEPGWTHLTAQAEQEFSREGLRQITAVCRLMATKNVLIKRGLSLRTAYIWGQGVEISARSTAKTRKGSRGAKQDVNAVIQGFLDDTGNRRTLTSPQAAEENERALGTDGNLFFALFTSPRTGRVQVRNIPWDEIADIICNPEDSSEPWFYKRVWYETSNDEITGGYSAKMRTAYYPALGHKPKGARPKTVGHQLGGDAPIMWDAPVYHVRVNGLKGWKYGVPDTYAAIDWAAAYKEFLTDWAVLIKALSRFAWKLTSKGSKQAAARQRIAAGPTTDRYSGEPQHAGGTALLTHDMMLESVPKTGATIDSGSGRPLAAMVAAGLDIPVTMLLADPGTTGARATAETLDTPTERVMELRQGVWTEMYQAILTYVIAASVNATQGALKGKIVLDPDGRETTELTGDVDQTLDISWPDIDDLDAGTVIEAIVKADGTTYMPPLVTVRLLLEALRVKDLDSILEALTGEDGEFKPPGGAAAGAGQAAVDAFRNGDDPAALLAGRDPNADNPDEEPDPDEAPAEPEPDEA